MITLLVQDHQVQLRSFHDLSWLEGWGSVFRVFDQLTDGTLGFGVQRGNQKFYLRYAGASTLGYPAATHLAVERLRRAAAHYPPQPHPALTTLVEASEMPQGFLCAFEWLDGIPLAPLEQNYALFRQTPLLERLRMFDNMLHLHAQLEEQGLVALGMADSHLMYDSADLRLVVTSIDDYLALPAVNTRGRTPGSPYYLAPECYQKNAALDETTTVFALGSLAHCLFGDRIHKKKEAWQAPWLLYEVAHRALLLDRNLRYQSTQALLQAWRQAVLKSPVN